MSDIASFIANATLNSVNEQFAEHISKLEKKVEKLEKENKKLHDIALSELDEWDKCKGFSKHFYEALSVIRKEMEDDTNHE